ncbi:MAG: Maf family protein [Firmicutes bacterium]|nr:Maf family protein [Bacillota bacterium]HAL62860.1 septum formation inhibitor Maf [Clostridiales bacterium]
MKKIILASASPRRREILEKLGLEFEVLVSSADESKIDKNSVEAPLYVQELALLKAAAVAEKLKSRNALIISADTIVCLDGQILGKPKNEEDAEYMLSKLSGRTHSVFSGICVMDAKTLKSVCAKEETKVSFCEITPEKIKAYVKTGEPMDKAGSYAVQGLGALFTEKIEGDFFNVIGLPVKKLSEILEKEFEFDIFKELKQ